MTHRIAVGASLAVVMLIGFAIAAEDLQSGPAVGKQLPGPFHPLNVTGDNAGQKFCLV